MTEVRNACVTRHNDISRASDGDLLAKVQTLYLAVNPETGQPRRFPPGMLEDYAGNIAEGLR